MHNTKVIDNSCGGTDWQKGPEKEVRLCLCLCDGLCICIYVYLCFCSCFWVWLCLCICSVYLICLVRERLSRACDCVYTSGTKS